jgi:hypothetical protein
VLKDTSIKTGEWSHNKYRRYFALRQWFGIPIITQVNQIWHFYNCWPVHGFAGRKVLEIIGSQSHEKLSTPWCDQPRSPSQIFCVVVASNNKSSIEILELCFAYDRSLMAVHCCEG